METKKGQQKFQRNDSILTWKETSPNKDDKIKTLDKRIYVLERRRLGSDFCDFCEMEYKMGCEKDRKEKDAHIRANHTFECSICAFKLQTKEEFVIHQSTCEMYVCSLCCYTHKRLSELKSHCKSKHTQNTIIRSILGGIFHCFIAINFNL